MRRGHPARRYRATPRKSGAPAKVGLIWSAKDGRVERGGLAPPNKACWNISKGGVGSNQDMRFVPQCTIEAVLSHTQIFKECGAMGKSDCLSRICSF